MVLSFHGRARFCLLAVAFPSEFYSTAFPAAEAAALGNLREVNFLDSTL